VYVFEQAFHYIAISFSTTCRKGIIFYKKKSICFLKMKIDFKSSIEYESKQPFSLVSG
jgi:hypothetical protein